MQNWPLLTLTGAILFQSSEGTYHLSKGDLEATKVGEGFVIHFNSNATNVPNSTTEVAITYTITTKRSDSESSNATIKTTGLISSNITEVVNETSAVLPLDIEDIVSDDTAADFYIKNTSRLFVEQRLESGNPVFQIRGLTGEFNVAYLYSTVGVVVFNMGENQYYMVEIGKSQANLITGVTGRFGHITVGSNQSGRSIF